jgi:uncharacterized repeat protein (TIGR01451 family)
MKRTWTGGRAGITRRAAARAAIAVLLVAVAIGGAAASGRAAAPALTITKTSTPTAVTRGYNVLYTITVTSGSTTANHVTVSDPATGESLPAGTKFVKATTDTGTCPAVTASTTSVTCDLGSLTAGQVAKVKVVLTIPASLTGNSFTNTASAKLNEGVNDQQPQASHLDTFTTSVDTNVVAAGDKNQASGYFETACNPAAANDPSLLSTNQSLEAGNLQSTEACVPDFGGGTTMFLAETAHTGTDPGFSETSTICVPTPGGTCSTPLKFSAPATFKFRLSPLEFPKAFNYKQLIVYDDRVQVTATCNADGSLPSGTTVCKFAPTQDKDTKIVTQVVKSLSNGSWQFG